MLDVAASISLGLSIVSTIVGTLSALWAFRAQKATKEFLKSKEGPIEITGNTDEQPALIVEHDEGDDRA